MKDIGAVTIGKLIEAHYEKDEHKFKAYAEFIAEAYHEMGAERAERIIRSKIDGSYKNKLVVVALDKEIKEK
jgi:coenzyme F420-reducing hydrogenase delta subunit